MTPVLKITYSRGVCTIKQSINGAAIKLARRVKDQKQQFSVWLHNVITSIVSRTILLAACKNGISAYLMLLKRL